MDNGRSNRQGWSGVKINQEYSQHLEKVISEFQKHTDKAYRLQ